ncbi:MAG TPA: UDP-N-acetylglucosamine 2-epimerase (non-hydrolyzing) [Methanofastidiosum sp.]|nr:UDP-N-acetylglucosamine 2-epimerase (non-hydrolyzing) [Methanofastidiosum sp.]HQK63309.1 UDP-N-acetylglucosamine 2-epimerase (non-hydrolyzing) [Methanofastidiosum sp.]
MKIVTILGTRPEIIRMSRIIETIDKFSEHILIHTGQNYDNSLSDIFFDEMKVRKPNYHLGIKSSSFGEQVGKIIQKTEEIIKKEKPDKILVLGDTNSSLSVIPAKRMGIPIYHLEAGNRCYDDRVPEEINRRIIDHTSDILLPYTERSKMNLMLEGIKQDRIFVIGNPINEVINHFNKEINNSKILSNLNLKKGKYFLITMHRAENVDLENRLNSICDSLEAIEKEYGLPIICSLHPHTKDKMEKFGIEFNKNNIYYYKPFGFFDFIQLEKNSRGVLTDSGTVQEECCILKVPTVTIRDVTERPETLECGSNILSGVETNDIINSLNIALSSSKDWTPPWEYTVDNVSKIVTKIVNGFYKG